MKKCLWIVVVLLAGACGAFGQGQNKILSTSSSEGPAGERVTGVASATSNAETTVLAAPAAGLRYYITDLRISNSGGSDSVIDVKDGPSGTILDTIIAPSGGGWGPPLNTPIVLSSATALVLSNRTSSTTLHYSVKGKKAP